MPWAKGQPPPHVVFPTWEDFLDGYSEIVQWPNLHDAPVTTLNYQALKRRPKLRQLRDALDTWAVRWHLTSDWCKDAALQTLAFWRKQPERIEEVPPFWVGIPERRQPKQVERDKAENVRLLRQLIDPTRIRIRSMEKSLRLLTLERFLWLAGYQVKGWSFGKIAEALGRDNSESTVGKQIKELADLINLELRKSAESSATAEAIREALSAAATADPAFRRQRRPPPPDQSEIDAQ